jgi:hypothetical protein
MVNITILAPYPFNTVAPINAETSLDRPLAPISLANPLFFVLFCTVYGMPCSYNKNFIKIIFF